MYDMKKPKTSWMGPVRGSGKKKSSKPLDEGLALRIRTIMGLIEDELRSASRQHGRFHSSHEGYAVIKEEVEELWDEIKKKTKNRSDKRMLEESVQVGAMAARFILDLL